MAKKTSVPRAVGPKATAKRTAAKRVFPNITEDNIQDQIKQFDNRLSFLTQKSMSHTNFREACEIRQGPPSCSDFEETIKGLTPDEQNEMRDWHEKIDAFLRKRNYESASDAWKRKLEEERARAKASSHKPRTDLGAERDMRLKSKRIFKKSSNPYASYSPWFHDREGVGHRSDIDGIDYIPITAEDADNTTYETPLNSVAMAYGEKIVVADTEMVRPSGGSEEVSAFVLSTFPSLGVAAAKKLALKYKSVEEIANASPGEVKSIFRKKGDQTAAQIIEAAKKTTLQRRQ